MLGGQHDRDDFVKAARPERAVVLDVARRIAAETHVFVRAPGVIQDAPMDVKDLPGRNLPGWR